jgi:hypothetical protein
MSEVKKAVFWNESDDGGVSIREWSAKVEHVPDSEN